MLFNSYSFLFAFLPVALLGYFTLGRRYGGLAAIGFLAGASLYFYAWWNPRYLPLLAASVVFNYFVGRRLSAHPSAPQGNRPLLAFGIAANLALLGWFKYAGFFAANLDAALGLGLWVPQIVLPLGISFFTFTQIAYLVDAHRKEVREYSFVHYVLFVTFFPHLLAGPVLHHAEIMPQFARTGTFRPSAENFSIGFTIFAIGLFKKVILADGCAEFSTPVFAAAARGEVIGGIAAWCGALAYSFQLYFDFSGYSDMAIGLARLFGIVFPANFNSPYKATSIIDFWRRWHMTLSRFLRDYLYIPLGGNRRGPARRHINMFATMLLGGFWHGAGWTFLAWGALHGIYLVINHAWLDIVGRSHGGPVRRWTARLLTFVAVVAAWVLFRADSIGAATAIFRGMMGLNSFAWAGIDWGPSAAMRWLLVMFAVVWALPNVQQLLHRHVPALETYPGEVAPPRWKRLAWRPTAAWALLTAVLFVGALINLSHLSEFLYYQF